MRARTHLLRVQRTLYHRLERYARRLFGSMSPALKRYSQEYQRDLTDFKEVSSKKELLEDLESSQVVLCGDYHTLSQAQRTVIRLLRDVAPGLKMKSRPLVLGLEMLRAKDTLHANAFLAGDLSEDRFLEATQFRKSWGFNWDNYRSLFDFAREHSVEIFGITPNTGASLAARDRFAAKAIAQMVDQNPEALIFVLMGDLHLAKTHLPKALHLEFSRVHSEPRLLVIHQNVEQFYWRLADRGLETLADVLKVREAEYCVMSTPPWVKLQSHVRWTEVMAEETTTENLDTVDYADEIGEMVETIRHFVGLEEIELDAFQLAGPSDLSFLDRLEANKSLTPTQLRLLGCYLSEFESLFISEENILFLSSLSVNHAAAQAAAYLHATCSGNLSLFEKPRNDFYRHVWAEALGFLGSKIINPKRKCNGPKDFEILYTRKKIREADWARRHLQKEKQRRKLPSLPSKVSESQALFLYKSAKLLGALLGQGLHTALVENEVSRDEIRLLFCHPFAGSEARRLYIVWGQRLDDLEFREVSKSDRL